MIQKSYFELHRLQTAAVVALKPLTRETRIKSAGDLHELCMAALREKDVLSFTRFLSTQIGLPDAARRTHEATRGAFDVLQALIAECERELATAEAAHG